ncbi:uncharacterized protein LOC110314599 [Mus pahari]|uniref:uncharacterized protein LOC110314599 n=1 Tax=Mus pahari TaxID=10093 RepID=UPI0011148249|nr:uncharacterized protein LOC110314599 [Mus pahari]
MGTGLEATEQGNHRTHRNDIQLENAKAAGKMGISVELEAKYGKLVLNLGAITLGEKYRKNMKNSHLRKEENANISLAVCALLNSGGGEIKVKIENENYSLTRDGLGLDLEASLCKCLPFVQWHLDFAESEGYIYIYVKPWSQEIFVLPIGTLRTNLYIRSMSSSVEMSAAATLEFLQDLEETGGRPCVRPELPAGITCPGVEGEWQLEDLATALFNKTEFQYEETFPFTRSRYVEVTLFSVKRLRKRIKELLPQTVSAFANRDGGFLFIGLDGKNQQIIGFEAKKSDLVRLESEIEKCIRQLPVTHFCEEKGKIKYTCKFIEVHKSGAVCSYVCALRVERFCCAVFAAEPESWHVEGSCVKRFTTEEWVKLQMDTLTLAYPLLNVSRLRHFKDCWLRVTPENNSQLPLTGSPVILPRNLTSPFVICPDSDVAMTPYLSSIPLFGVVNCFKTSRTCSVGTLSSLDCNLTTTLIPHLCHNALQPKTRQFFVTLRYITAYQPGGVCMLVLLFPELGVIQGKEPLPIPVVDMIAAQHKKAAQVALLLVAVGTAISAGTRFAAITTSITQYDTFTSEISIGFQEMSETMLTVQKQIDDLADVDYQPLSTAEPDVNVCQVDPDGDLIPRQQESVSEIQHPHSPFTVKISSREQQDCQKMNITVERTHPVLILNAGEITLGIKSRNNMETHDRVEENRNISKALCALMNYGKGKVKAHIKNPDYSLTKHGIGDDLETSFKNILPSRPLDFEQDQSYFFICVKSQSPDISVVKPATIATNLYMRNGASSVEMNLYAAQEFLEKIKVAGGRSPSARPSERPSDDAQEEVHVQELAADFFKQSKLTKMEKILFSESKNVEYKSFETKNLLKRVKEILPRTVSAFANTDGGYLFIGLDEKNQQIIGFEAKNCQPNHLKSTIDKYIQKLPVTHFCEEKGKIKYTCKFIEVHDFGAVCSYVCALRVERFCCAVFAAEPESWHVEGSCVKRFTAEEWVKRQMDATEVMPGKVICSPEALCMKPFSQYEGYGQLVRTELSSLCRGTLVVPKSWALDLGLQEKQEAIWDMLHISQGSLLTLYVFVRGDENLEDTSTLLEELGAELKGYYKQTALTLKQTLLNHIGCTAKIGIIVKITYLGHKTKCLYDSSSKIRYSEEYYLMPKTVSYLEKALAEILGSHVSFYSLPR